MSFNSKSRESPVVTAQAYVLLYDANKKLWMPSGDVQSLSCIQLLRQEDKESFRIVGWRQPDNQIVVNSMLKAGMQYQSHGNFQEWRDSISQSVYGLKFSVGEEAQLFFETVKMVLAKLATVSNSMSAGMLQPEDVSRNGGGKQLVDPTGPSPGDRQRIISGGTATSGLLEGEYAVPVKPPEPTADAKQLQFLSPNSQDLSFPGEQVDGEAEARLSTGSRLLHNRQPSTASSASLGYATGGSSHPGSMVVPLPYGATTPTSASAISAAPFFSSPSCSSSSGSPSSCGYGYGYGQGSVNSGGEGGSSFAIAAQAAVRTASGPMTLTQLLQSRQSNKNGWSESLGTATNGAAGTLSQVDRLQPTSIQQRPTSPELTTSHLGDKERDSHALSSSCSGLDPFIGGKANPPPPPPPGTTQKPDMECLQASGPRPSPPPRLPILSTMSKNSVPSGSATGSQLVVTNTESLAAGSSSMSTLEKSSNSCYPSMAVSSAIPPPPLLPPTGITLRKQSGNKGDAGGSSPTPTATTALTTTTNTTLPTASSTTQRGNTSAGGSATPSSTIIQEMQRLIQARRRLVDAAETGEGAVPPLHEVKGNTLPSPGGLPIPTKSPAASTECPTPLQTKPRGPAVLARVASASQRTVAPTPSTESVTSHSMRLSSTSREATPITKPDLETLRREILNDLRCELTSVKNEILDCIRLRKSL